MVTTYIMKEGRKGTTKNFRPIRNWGPVKRVNRSSIVYIWQHLVSSGDTSVGGGEERGPSTPRRNLSDQTTHRMGRKKLVLLGS